METKENNVVLNTEFSAKFLLNDRYIRFNKIFFNMAVTCAF